MDDVRVIKQTVLLKVLVGSRAHDLHTEESDYDYRGVFIYPTKDLLGLRPPKDQTSWIEGKTDDTLWELQKFLIMACQCNPSILEVFKSPIIETDKAGYGAELVSLFDHVWNSQRVKDAFIGYGLNQRKKFLDNKDDRPHKYAVAYLRTLYNAYSLLTSGTFSMSIKDTEVEAPLRRWKAKDYSIGEVIELTYKWQKRVEDAYDSTNKKETNFEAVEKWLLKVRKAYWNVNK